jgi:hypothetical protein
VDARTELERYKDSLVLTENRLERTKRDAALALEARAEELARELVKSNKIPPEPVVKQDEDDGSDDRVGICYIGGDAIALRQMLLRRTA